MDTVQLSIRAALFVGSFLTRFNLSGVAAPDYGLLLTMDPDPLTHGGRKIQSTLFLAVFPLVELLRFHPGHAIAATKRKKKYSYPTQYTD